MKSVSFANTTVKVSGDYFDITDVLKKYRKKRAIDWWNSAETKEYAKEVAKTLNVEISTLFQTTQGRHGRTKVHERLILFFARWLDVNFAIACDNFLKQNFKQLEAENERLRIAQNEFWHQWDDEDQKDLYE
jgi:hypothetical protein